jgi:hypothetical protein
MGQCDVSRIPINFARIRHKEAPAYQPENALFRQMLQDFRRPPWCQEVVVAAEGAYAPS